MRYIPKQQLEKSLTALRRGGLKTRQNYMIFKTLAYSGMRVTELINLRKQDILIDESQIIVRGKGNKIRNVDIPKHLLEDILAYIKDTKPNKKPIFPFTRQNIYAITMALSGYNPHAFRHSYAIELLKKSKNIRYVQVQLGHSRMSTTEQYLRFMEFDDSKKQLEEIF